MTIKKQIGILGGTFDPVHHGHLHLAIQMLEIHNLSEVWWIPAQINPLKGNPLTPAQHRLEMLKLALADIPQFKILEEELKREGPSYTIDTLRELKKTIAQDCKLHLILGDDALANFTQWKEPGEIVRLAPPLIGARNSARFPETLEMPKELREVLMHGWTAIPLMEISATDIRKRLKMRRFCEHLLPVKVLDYISRFGLYFT